MRIYKDKFYIMESIPGISGFKRCNEREYHIVTGHKAANHRLGIVRQFLCNERGKFRLENGRCPEYQPIVSEKEVMPWLETERYGMAFILNPDVYNLEVNK